MATNPGLEQIQRWMQACIEHQGSCDEALVAEPANSAIPADQARTVVLPSKTLGALERLDIYRDMYLLRMEEALGADYPAIKHFLGDDDFLRLVAEYVKEFPSRSYTLNRLGDHFPEFIATRGDLPKKDFCADLARLELGLTYVFDAGETPSMTQETVQSVPPDAWENARLKPIEAFRLLEFDYPVSQYLGFVDEENSKPRLARKKTWVVGYRRNYHVHRLDLSGPAYELLSALASGKTVGESIMSVMTRERKRPVRQKDLFDWFRDWMSEGLFQSVELAAPAMAAR